MSKKVINVTKEELYKLYIEDNKTVDEIAKYLNIGTATVNRHLKKFEITKSELQRRQAISATKQAKTIEEKQLYSQHISEARRGKGTGNIPWNKGKTGCQTAWNKGLKMSADFIEAVRNGLATMTEEQKHTQSVKLQAALSGRVPSNKGVPMTEDQKQKLRAIWTGLSAEQQQAIIKRQYETKILNNTCNSSSPEDCYYTYLINKFGKDDVIRQYSDERYPFHCDFYIRSKDLFIELNLHWSHGGRPYNEQLDANKLAIWVKKSETSEFYKAAIETWTVRDVLKTKTAADNNLNYLVFYTEEELYAD